MGPPQGTLEIPLSRGYFAQFTPRYCLKFMSTPSLPNYAECQIDHSQNNAIFSIQFPFSRSKICRITPSRFPLAGSNKHFCLNMEGENHTMDKQEVNIDILLAVKVFLNVQNGS